jgi:3-oxoacyl-[acyl-carrier protein] reductase
MPRLTRLSRSIAGRTALVTGAASGMGRATAILFADEGARVAVADRDGPGVARVADQIAQAGGQAATFPVDVGDPAAVAALASAVRDRLGPIDILINNAGITRDNLLVRMKEEEWDAIMDTNLKSAYRLSKAVLRGMMKARHGRIINIGSVVGTSGNAGQANYSAAKAALIGFTKSLAQEVGSRDITVNCVAPGFVDTEMTRALPDAQRDKLLERIPLGRLGAPEDIAHAVAFLASDAAGYITGATLHVNGGMYMA